MDQFELLCKHYKILPMVGSEPRIFVIGGKRSAYFATVTALPWCKNGVLKESTQYKNYPRPVSAVTNFINSGRIDLTSLTLNQSQQFEVEEDFQLRI